MSIKAIVIGASTSGKTTLLGRIRGKMSLIMEESDDVLTAMNGGVYPKDDNYKMKILVPKMVDDVLAQKEILFFSNTHYFTNEDLKKAREKGFKIIQLGVNKKEMLNRNIYRVDNLGYEDLSRFFKSMTDYQKKIFEEGLVDKVLDGAGEVDDLAIELQDYLMEG
jgi:GTPase SAR1 family protein